MRSTGNLFIALLSCAAIACGGDDGGDGNNDNNNDSDNTDITVDDGDTDDSDDVVLPDAATPDAPTSTAAQALGKICTTNTDCPAAAPTCVGLVQGGARFCTAPCGTSADTMTPPMDGNAACAAVTPALPSGTPACALYPNPAPAPPIPWSCAIICGTVETPNGPFEAGECPQGLTCGSNFCQ